VIASVETKKVIAKPEKLYFILTREKSQPKVGETERVRDRAFFFSRCSFLAVVAKERTSPGILCGLKPEIFFCHLKVMSVFFTLKLVFTVFLTL